MTIDKNTNAYNYLFTNSKGDLIRKTSFVMNFLYKINGRESVEYLVELKYLKSKGETGSLTTVMDASVLSNAQLFREFMVAKGMSYCNVNASELSMILDNEVTKQDIKTINRVKHIGYHGNKFIVSNGIVTKNGFKEYDSHRIADDVLYSPVQEDASNSAYLLHDEKDNEKQIVDTIIHMNSGHLDGLFCLSFLKATLYASRIHEINGFFPMLFVGGEKGTGKNFFVRTISHVLGFKRDGDGLPATSKVGFTRRLEHFIDFPYWIDEYSSDRQSRLKADDALRSAFNRSLLTKGTKDPDKLVNIKPTASVIISGESLPEDAATRDRFVTVELSDKKKNPSMLAEINTLLPEFPHVGKKWMIEALNIDFKDVWKQITNINNEYLREYPKSSQRLLTNYSILTYFLGTILRSTGLNSSEMITKTQLFIRGQIEIENEDRDDGNAIKDLWTSFIYLVSKSALIEDRDYTIKGNDLCIYFISFWDELKKNDRLTGKESRLSKRSFLKYLSQHYKVEHKAVRFGEKAKKAHCFDLTELPSELQEYFEITLDEQAPF